MEALDSLGNVLKDYEKSGFRVSVEISQKEYLKLAAFVVGVTLLAVLSIQLVKGIFKQA
jgi:hypothetical protein